MKRKNDKTTVLFVNKNAQAMKPIQLSNQLILHWKKYLAAISVLFLALISTIIFLTRNNIHQYHAEVTLNTKMHEMHTIFAQVDTIAIKKKFTKIDEDLSTINSFLRARGIQGISKDPQGGEADDDIISTDDISDFYDKYLHKIIYNISYTPLGYPYPGRITSTFGHRENPFSGEGIETHKGLDIKGPIGSPVKAMAKGTVEFAGLRGGFGNCIMLKHGNGFETLYGHLSKILVHLGQQIEIGQSIGLIGSTGRSTGPHLHYEIHKNGVKIDPKNFLTLK